MLDDSLYEYQEELLECGAGLYKKLKLAKVELWKIVYLSACFVKEQ
jgi:hypothetical protein